MERVDTELADTRVISEKSVGDIMNSCDEKRKLLIQEMKRKFTCSYGGLLTITLAWCCRGYGKEWMLLYFFVYCFQFLFFYFYILRRSNEFYCYITLLVHSSCHVLLLCEGSRFICVPIIIAIRYPLFSERERRNHPMLFICVIIVAYFLRKLPWEYLWPTRVHLFSGDSCILSSVVMIWTGFQMYYDVWKYFEWKCSVHDSLYSLNFHLKHEDRGLQVLVLQFCDALRNGFSGIVCPLEEFKEENNNNECYLGKELKSRLDEALDHSFFLSNHCLEQASTLSYFCDFESKNYRVDIRRFNLKKLVKRTIKTRRYFLRIEDKPELKIEEAFSHEDLPTFAVGDEMRLYEVFNNVISNAIKFSDRGTILVIIEYDYEKEKLYFFCRDEGIGLSEMKMKILGTHFLCPSEDGTRESFGLGLYITRNIVVDLFGGKIEFTSDGRNKGTQVDIEIPLPIDRENQGEEEEDEEDDFFKEDKITQEEEEQEEEENEGEEEFDEDEEDDFLSKNPSMIIFPDDDDDNDGIRRNKINGLEFREEEEKGEDDPFPNRFETLTSLRTQKTYNFPFRILIVDQSEESRTAIHLMCRHRAPNAKIKSFSTPSVAVRRLHETGFQPNLIFVDPNHPLWAKKNIFLNFLKRLRSHKLIDVDCSIYTLYTIPENRNSHLVGCVFQLGEGDDISNETSIPMISDDLLKPVSVSKICSILRKTSKVIYRRRSSLEDVKRMMKMMDIENKHKKTFIRKRNIDHHKQQLLALQQQHENYSKHGQFQQRRASCTNLERKKKDKFVNESFDEEDEDFTDSSLHINAPKGIFDVCFQKDEELKMSPIRLSYFRSLFESFDGWRDHSPEFIKMTYYERIKEFVDTYALQYFHHCIFSVCCLIAYIFIFRYFREESSLGTFEVIFRFSTFIFMLITPMKAIFHMFIRVVVCGTIESSNLITNFVTTIVFVFFQSTNNINILRFMVEKSCDAKSKLEMKKWLWFFISVFVLSEICFEYVLILKYFNVIETKPFWIRSSFDWEFFCDIFMLLNSYGLVRNLIQEKAELEDVLQSRIIRVEASKEERKIFLSRVSHELRSPLHAFEYYFDEFVNLLKIVHTEEIRQQRRKRRLSQRIDDDDDNNNNNVIELPKLFRKRIDLILKSSNRIERIVANLFVVCRYESDRIREVPRVFDLYSELKTLFMTQTFVFKNKHIRVLINDFEEMKNIGIYGDYKAFLLILQNVLVNAFEYSKRRRKGQRVKITAKLLPYESSKDKHHHHIKDKKNKKSNKKYGKLITDNMNKMRGGKGRWRKQQGFPEGVYIEKGLPLLDRTFVFVVKDTGMGMSKNEVDDLFKLFKDEEATQKKEEQEEKEDDFDLFHTKKNKKDEDENINNDDDEIEGESDVLELELKESNENKTRIITSSSSSSSSSTSAVKKMSIGMFCSYQLGKLFGGKFVVETKKFVGTKVTYTCTLKTIVGRTYDEIKTKSHLGSSSSISSSSKKSRGSSKPYKNQGIRRIRIKKPFDRVRVFVIDDFPIIPKILRHTLRRIGFLEKNIYSANRVSEGYSIYRRNGPFDIAFLDYNIGNVTVQEFLERVDGNMEPDDFGYEIRVVITGGAGHMEEEEMKRLGIVSVLTKPVSETDLRKCLSMIL